MNPTTDEKLQRADQRVTRCKNGLAFELDRLDLRDSQRKSVERAARDLGTAVASLCIEVERMAEQEGWHDGDG